MHRADLFAFTKNGRRTAERILQTLQQQGLSVHPHVPERLADEQFPGFQDLMQTAGAVFADTDALIFVGATGIAVRAIAPYIKDKLADPAVLVVDEAAHVLIPILSGHAGGANDLARQLAKALDAVPVITTATDLQDQFSVDTFAVQQHLRIVEKDEIKHLSGALLAGEPIGALTPKSGFVISPHPVGHPFSHTLHLVPQDLVLGMGCRKGTPLEGLKEFVAECFGEQGLSIYRIRAMASVDQKAEEPGLKALAGDLGVPFFTYSAEELLTQQGTFAGSDFVRQTVGVDNVCERSALCAAVKEGWLPAGSCFDHFVRLKKQARDGMTLAVVGLIMSNDFL